MGAYATVTEGETTTYSYMQSDEIKDNVQNGYYFVSYEDVVGLKASTDVTQ